MIKASTLSCLNLFTESALYQEPDTACRIKNTIVMLKEGKCLEDEQAVDDAIYLVDSAIELTQAVATKIDEVEKKGHFLELLKDLEELKNSLD